MKYLFAFCLVFLSVVAVAQHTEGILFTASDGGDSTRLVQDSILVYLNENGESGRDTIRVAQMLAEIRADQVSVESNSFTQQTVLAVLEFLLVQIQNDGDTDSTNELQTLSYVNNVVGLTGQSGQITQQEINYWQKNNDNLFHNGTASVGAPALEKGEKFYVNGGVITRTNGTNDYRFTGLNDNVPAIVEADDVLVIPMNVGGVYATINVDFFFYSTSSYSNSHAKFTVNFYAFNGSSSNSKNIIVEGHNPFSDVRLLRFGGNEYGLAFFGYSTAAVERIRTAIDYRHRFGNNYIPAPNYRISQADLSNLGDQLAPLTNSDNVQKLFKINGKISAQTDNYPASTKFAVLDNQDRIGFRTFDPASLTRFDFIPSSNALRNNTGQRLGMNTNAQYTLDILDPSTNFPYPARFKNSFGSSGKEMIIRGDRFFAGWQSGEDLSTHAGVISNNDHIFIGKTNKQFIARDNQVFSFPPISVTPSGSIASSLYARSFSVGSTEPRWIDSASNDYSLGYAWDASSQKYLTNDRHKGKRVTIAIIELASLPANQTLLIDLGDVPDKVASMNLSFRQGAEEFYSGGGDVNFGTNSENFKIKRPNTTSSFFAVTNTSLSTAISNIEITLRYTKNTN